eukprot:5359472-Amphidinium_carterae.1
MRTCNGTTLHGTLLTRAECVCVWVCENLLFVQRSTASPEGAAGKGGNVQEQCDLFGWQAKAAPKAEEQSVVVDQQLN